MFKKLVCFITLLSTLLALSLSSVYAIEDDYSNYLGVIRDKDGNVVETIPFPTGRAIYVNSMYTLPAGGTFTSYQYEPSMGFSIGFSYSSPNGTTTRNRTVKLEIFNSSSIGGTRYLVKRDSSVSTNIEDNKYDEGLGSCLLGVLSISASRPYYNGVITNTSSQSMNINILVVCD